MIIKSSRILTGDGPKLAKYFGSPGENEDVEILLGLPEIVIANDMVSGIHNRMYGTRHVIISPEKHLSKRQLGEAIELICKEYEVSEPSLRRIVVVRHEKKRSDYVSEEDRQPYEEYSEPENDLHYHLGIPEVDERTGRVLDHEFSKIRDEKLSRLLEIKFKHQHVLGRFNKEILEEIESEKFWVSDEVFDPDIHALVRQNTEDDTIEAYLAAEDGKRVVSWNTSRYHSDLKAAYTDCLGVSEGIDYCETNYLGFRVFGRLNQRITKTTARLGVNIQKLSKWLSGTMKCYAKAEITAAQAAHQVIREVKLFQLNIKYAEGSGRLYLTSDINGKSTYIATLRKLCGIELDVLKGLESALLEAMSIDATDAEDVRSHRGASAARHF